MIQSRILLDSITIGGSRLTTWLLTMPRYSLVEFNTHRMISKNCPSSRAIPVEKRIQMVLDGPVMPEWTEEAAGMQSPGLVAPLTADLAARVWLEARDQAVARARELISLGIHKQVANRLLEPFAWVTVLATGVQPAWENFLALRAHGDADPMIQILAYDMLEKYNASTPTLLRPDQWHIPFGDQMPEGLHWSDQIKVAVARSARVSYDNFTGAPSVEKDIKLHDRLAQSGHWSAFEHIARAENLGPAFSGNLPGWVQLRKTYVNEYRSDERVVKHV